MSEGQFTSAEHARSLPALPMPDTQLADITDMVANAIQPDAFPALQQLCQQLAGEATEASTRRQHERLNVSAPVSIGIILRNDEQTTTDGPPQFRPLHQAWLTDLSLGGIGVLMEHELPRDVTLWINLNTLAQHTLLLPIRIVYSRQLLPNTWRLGACFADQ